jgi:outer membrane protein assembly factor BamB
MLQPLACLTAAPGYLRRPLAALLAILGAALLLLLPPVPGGSATTGYDWATYGFDLARTGFNPLEATLSAANVGRLRQLWSADLVGFITAQPMYAAGVRVGSQTLDVLYVGTEAGDLVALNALTGAQLWRRNLGTQFDFCSTNGVTGAPVLDRSTNRLYAAGGSGQVYALDLSTGAVAPGWPVAATTMPATEKVWSALTLANGALYVPVSGHCGDAPPYYGRVEAIDPASAEPLGAFVTVPKSLGGGGGIWGYGGVSVNASGHVFAASGNAINADEGVAFAESVIELTRALRLVGANNPGIPSRGDNDFGSTPVLFQAPGCPAQLTALNKIGTLYLYVQGDVNAGPLQQMAISGANLIGLSAYWLNGRLVISPVDVARGGLQPGLVAHRVGSDCRLSQVWNAALGSSTTFSSATIANGVAYVGSGTNGKAYGLNVQTGATLWTGQTQGAVYAPPIVANGRVYVVSWDQHVYAYGL